jgi:hypothetical protein
VASFGTTSGPTFVLPSKCCVCLAPAETHIRVSHVHRTSLSSSVTHTLQVPACRACASREGSRKLFRIGLLAAFAAVGWFAFRAIFPGEEGAPPGGGLIGLLLGGVVVGILRRVHPDPLGTDLNGKPIFLNPEYNQLFQELNESEPVQARRVETANLWAAAADAEKGKNSPDPGLALLHAALVGRSDKVQALLRQGADANAKAENGYTALMLAASKGHAAAVQALIAGGADVHARTLLGSTAQMLAEWEGHSNVVRQLTAGAGAAAEPQGHA